MASADWVPRLSAAGRPRPLIAAGVAVFIVHDIEELATVEAWTRARAPLMPGPVRSLVPVETAEFAVAIAVVLLIFAAVAAWAWADRSGGRGPALDLFLLLVAVIGVNAVAHALQAVAFRGYVPGLVSALGLALPYSVWAFRGAWRARLRSGRRLLALAGIAAVVHTPLAAAAVWVGKALV